MANDNFVEILKDLEGKKAKSEIEYERFTENIDLLIKNAQAIIKSNDERECAFPPSVLQKAKDNQNHKQKIKAEEIIQILRKAKKTLHIDEICKIIGDQKGTEISRIVISMVIYHHIRKYKSKAEIKKLEKFNYRIK